jgi:hypothetical protein
LDIFTFTVEMTKALASLAWPILVGLGLFRFHRQLSDMLSGVKLRRIGQGKFKAEFETIAGEVRGELPKVELSSPSTTSRLIPKKAQLLISSSPVDAIFSAAEQLEGIINAASARAKIKKKSWSETLEALFQKGFISGDVRDSLLGLQKLRNLAAHGPVERVTPKEAREFIALVEIAMWSLEENLKKNQR